MSSSCPGPLNATSSPGQARERPGVRALDAPWPTGLQNQRREADYLYLSISVPRPGSRYIRRVAFVRPHVARAHSCAAVATPFPVHLLPQIPQDARGDAPDIALAERHRVIGALDPLPVALEVLVIERLHQDIERHLEGVGDLARVERERVAGRDARDQRQDAEAGEREIEIEIAERLDQRTVEPDLLLGLAQGGAERPVVLLVDLAAGKRD